MGADLLMAHAIVTKKDGFKFQAAADKLERVEDKEEFRWDEFNLPGYHEYGSWEDYPIETLKDVGLEVLSDFADCLYADDVAMIDVGDYYVFVTGGMSWGGYPTDSFRTFTMLEGLPQSVLEASGVTF